MPEEGARWLATTHAEVGRFFGVQKNTVKGWGAEGMPGKQGGYDLSAIYAWLKRRDRRGGSDAANEKSKLEAEKLREEIRFKRRTNDLEEGLLWDSAAVRQWVAIIFTYLKGEIEAWPADMQMQWPEESRVETKADMEHYIHLALVRLAEAEVAPGVTFKDCVIATADEFRRGTEA